MRYTSREKFTTLLATLYQFVILSTVKYFSQYVKERAAYHDALRALADSCTTCCHTRSDRQRHSSSSDESPGVGLSLNRSQHDAALPSTTPRQERKSSTDYSEPRHRTEVDSDLRSRDARVKRTASISAIQMGFDVAPHVVKRD